MLGPLEARSEHGMVPSGRPATASPPRRAPASLRSGRPDRAARGRALRSGPSSNGDDLAPERRRRAPKGPRSRRPGHTSPGLRPAGLARCRPTRVASSSSSRMPAAPHCPSGAASSPRRSASGGDRHSRSSRSRTGPRRRPDGSTSSGSSPSSNGSPQTSSSGNAGDVVSELEAVAREHPLRERAARAADARALPRPDGRPRRSQAFAEARAALDELGIQPGEKLRQLQASILRHEAGLAPAADGRDRDAEAEIMKAIVAGRVVPVLGLDGATDLADGARGRVRLSERAPARPRARLPVRRDDERRRAALRRVAPALRGGDRAAGGAPIPRRASPPSCATTARRTSSSSRAVRPRARARVRGGGGGGRRRHLRRVGPHRGKFWHRPARRGAPPDRRAQHVCDGALARAAHGPAEAQRRRRPVPRAGMGELRHHRGRLHRLPRPVRRRRRRAGRARGAAPPEPLPLPRLRDGRLEPPARDAPGLGGPPGRVPLLGGRPGAHRARACFWRRFDIDVLDVEPDDYVGLFARRLEVPHERRSPYRGLARSKTPSSTHSSSSAGSATRRSSSRISSPRG